MKRYIDLNEISDGNLYTANDMVKIDCHGCQGCSACCRGMGNTVILDPLDIQRLAAGAKLTFADLINSGKIELNLVDGVILPNLKMGRQDGSVACGFLDENGRCSVHTFRPGICRLFPLGRYYEEDGFRYFLQIHECPKPDKTKTKIKKWLEIPNLQSYEAYIFAWHRFLKRCQKELAGLDDNSICVFQLYLLRTFYENPYTQEDIHKECCQRMEAFWETLGV